MVRGATAVRAARRTAVMAWRRRPRTEQALGWLLGFLGVTALGGGIEMLLFPRGNQYLPISLLDPVGFLDTFALPGIVLAGAFGVVPLVVLVGLVRRPQWAWLAPVERLTGRHWSWGGAAAVGVGFTTWMVTEIALLGPPWDAATTGDLVTGWVLYGIYCTVAASLLALSWSPSVRASTRLAPPDQP